MNRAVSLLELTVAMIIIGILAALAMPMFGRTMETTRAKEAVASLEQIRTAERVYRVEENTYWRTEGAVTDDNHAINQQLRLYLDERGERNWDYSITAPNAGEFTATARRRSGDNEDEVITINQDGGIGGDWSP